MTEIMTKTMPETMTKTMTKTITKTMTNTMAKKIEKNVKKNFFWQNLDLFGRLPNFSLNLIVFAKSSEFFSSA